MLKHAVVGVLLGLFVVAACSNNANPGGPDARIHIQDVQSNTMMPGPPSSSTASS